MFRSRSKTLTVREEREGLTVSYWPESRPWLMVTPLKAMQRLPFGEMLLRRWGYRRWGQDTVSPLAYYARPLPLWALLRTLERARWASWAFLWWLYNRGIFHLKDEYADFRWRDVRLGR